MTCGGCEAIAPRVNGTFLRRNSDGDYWYSDSLGEAILEWYFATPTVDPTIVMTLKLEGFNITATNGACTYSGGSCQQSSSCQYELLLELRGYVDTLDGGVPDPLPYDDDPWGSGAGNIPLTDLVALGGGGFCAYYDHSVTIVPGCGQVVRVGQPPINGGDFEFTAPTNWLYSGYDNTLTVTIDMGCEACLPYRAVSYGPSSGGNAKNISIDRREE